MITNDEKIMEIKPSVENEETQDPTQTIAPKETTEENGNSAETEGAKPDENAKAPAFDPEAFLRKTSSGTLQLIQPIRARGQDLTELQYNFPALTGWEYAEAMDADDKAKSIFRMTSKQALNVFAYAAGKATADVDSNDILERISVMDAQAAVQLSVLFFNACRMQGSKTTLKK